MVTHTKRQLNNLIEKLRIGEHSVGDLIEWLNKSKESDTREEEVIETIKTAVAVSKAIASLKAGVPLSKKESTSLQMRVALQNLAFVRVPLYAYLRLSGKEGVVYELRSPTPGNWPLCVALRLFIEGDLHRVRQCVCGVWFYAPRADQLVHSAKCRQKKYQDTDEYRQERRAYMKKYYELKKSGNVK